MALGGRKHKKTVHDKNLGLFDFSQIIRVLKMVWSCSKGLTIAKMFMLIVQAILPLIPIYLIALLLDEFAKDTPPDFTYLKWILVGFAATKIVNIIVSNINMYIGMLQSDVVADYMSNVVISKALDTDLEYFDSDIYYDIFQRAISSSSGRPLQVLNTVFGFFQNLLMLSVILFELFKFHWGIVFILFFVAIPVAIIKWYYTNKLVDLREAHTQPDRKSGYFKSVLTSSSYAKEVRIFSFGRMLLDVFLNIRKVLRKEKRDLYLKQARSVGFAQAIESIAIITALGFIVYRAVEGELTVGEISLYYGLFQKGQGNINSALKTAVSLHENRRFLEHLFTFLDLKKKIIDPIDPKSIPERVEQIKVSNLRFRYPQTKRPILKGINLEVNRGEILAIVGENGSGKTTLVKLLSRLYSPNAGSISINGVEVRKYKLDDLRKKMTVIFQQFAKYNATVTENIQFADVDKELDINEIIQSAKYAHAHKFISALPQGYDTQLGRSFKQGEELSGGQWQKMALSRAFYKKADIIILDEPTSHIDPLAEEDIFNSLKEIAKDKILILITHRIYNLKMADRIIVMEEGNIAEQGSHNELMNKDGLYRQMFNKQS